jgi:hypothetical protein
MYKKHDFYIFYYLHQAFGNLRKIDCKGLSRPSQKLKKKSFYKIQKFFFEGGVKNF